MFWLVFIRKEFISVWSTCKKYCFLQNVHGVHGMMYGVHGVHGELDIELNSRIKEKLMNHLNLINGLLVKKTQEMGRKKLTNRVKNSLNVEENSGMV